MFTLLISASLAYSLLKFPIFLAVPLGVQMEGGPCGNRLSYPLDRCRSNPTSAASAVGITQKTETAEDYEHAESSWQCSSVHLGLICGGWCAQMYTSVCVGICVGCVCVLQYKVDAQILVIPGVRNVTQIHTGFGVW